MTNDNTHASHIPSDPLSSLDGFLRFFEDITDPAQIVQLWNQIPVELEQPFLSAVETRIAEAEQAGATKRAEGLRQRLDELHRMLDLVQTAFAHIAQGVAQLEIATSGEAAAALWNEIPIELEESFLTAAERRSAELSDPAIAARMRGHIAQMRQAREARQQASNLPPIVRAFQDFLNASSDNASRQVFAFHRSLLQPYEAQRMANEWVERAPNELREHFAEHIALLRELRGGAAQPGTLLDATASAEPLLRQYTHWLGMAQASDGGTATVYSITNINLLQRSWNRRRPPALQREVVTRPHELAEVRTLLQTHGGAVIGARTLGVQGMPGVEKTTLANILALDLDQAYPDGVLWEVIGLEIRTPDQVQVILDRWGLLAVGVEFDPKAPPRFEVEAVRALLGEHPRLLVVLDNVWSKEAIALLRAALPPDAVRHGTTTAIVQRLHLAVAVVRFVREAWYVPSTRTTITAPLPPGYRGGFCPTIHALVLALGHGANVSQPALLTFLRSIGLQISTRTLARMLLDPDGAWAAEVQAVHQTGLATGSWVATDQTGTRVDGQNEVCHVVGNRWFTSSHTRPGGTRQDVLAVIWGQEPRFRLNDESLVWLQASTMPYTLFWRLHDALPSETDMTAAELQHHLATVGITLPCQQQQQVGDALAIAAYHAQTQVPVLGWLLSDDVPVYARLTATHARCWVHDWRHYAKPAPHVSHHSTQLDAFRKDSRSFYMDVLTYWKAPTPKERARLDDVFDMLVDQETGYVALDAQIIKTDGKWAQLLAVLKHLDIPLHNNDMELGARRRVHKRDVSFGPQSRTGASAWNTLQILAATGIKLGVGFFHSLRDRMVTPATTPTLAERVVQQGGIVVQSAT